MENVSEVNEDTTFNALKYKRYTSIDIVISGQFIPAKSTYWINDAGQLHRKTGPAMEFLSGARQWFQNGLKHRKDGPAIIRSNGTKEWFRNGKLHREDGPAIEGSNGTKIWYRYGLKHREDGPAIECANGTKSWWVNGKFIRSE